MTGGEDLQSVFRGPGVKAWLLRERGGWAIEVGVAEPNGTAYDQCRLELLVQSRGPDGLACGGVATIWQTVIGLVRFPNGDWRWGRANLPRTIGDDTAQQCYVRVTPLTQPTTANAS